MQASRLWAFPRFAVVAVALLSALVLLLLALPFAPLNMGSFCLFLFPFLLLFLTAAGPLPAALSLAAVLGGLMHAAGTQAALAGALYLFPGALVFFVCVRMRVPFMKTVAFVLGAYILPVLALYLAALASTQGDLFEKAAGAAVDALERLPGRDSYLFLLWRSGLLSLDAGAAGAVLPDLNGLPVFAPWALDEFFNQIRARAELWLRSLVPSLLSSYSLYLAVLGTGAALYLGRQRSRRAAARPGAGQTPESFDDLGMPSFSRWHVPRRQGRLLWVLPLFHLASRLSSGATLYLAGLMMYNAFSAVYSIQGMSLLNALQRRREVRPFLRGLTLGAVFLLFQPALVFAGLYDQLFDPRKLRGQTDSGKNRSDGRDST